MLSSFPLLALLFASLSLSSRAQAPGSFVQSGTTLVSGLMIFLVNDKTIMIVDKVEGNPTQINGHPAWATTWDIASNTATTIDMETNPFCSSGMHFPNGSFATFGGNGAITKGGDIGSVRNPGGASGAYDATYMDFDGSKAVRIYGPCDNNDGSLQCQWFDNSTQLHMAKQRWYSAAESLADGSVILIGGFVNGGYINRNTINDDPATSHGAAEPSYEFFPPRPEPPPVMQFMVNTSGLNAYAHTFLMPSGKLFVQANYSTILFDYDNNIETPLPDMPDMTVRVYPASGGVAMLPLTPENNYTPTVLFCGGQTGASIPADLWGDYGNPYLNTWLIPATNDCQRITPEPTDGSDPKYTKDDDMLEGRTMGQFIILPDATLLMINGGKNGTAGYATNTNETLSYADMPYGMSLASDPVLTPAIYNPNAKAGKRWSRKGLASSNIPRLYHSTALLLPDASVFVAGSNPNVDYNASTIFATEYRAEYFYPSYFAYTRPNPQGIPTTLSYGGPSFDITVTPDSYGGKSNDAATKMKVVLIRPGVTTHAMNMGQRYLQLNNTYTVGQDATITLHVSQVPPNPNLFTPGPALMFVIADGVPSMGTMVTVGNGQIGTQPTSDAVQLPPVATATGSVSGSATNVPKDSTSLSTGIIAAIAAGGAAVLIILCGTIFWCCRRKSEKVETTMPPPIGKEIFRSSDGSFGTSHHGLTDGYPTKPMSPSSYNKEGMMNPSYHSPGASSDSSTFIPLQSYNQQPNSVSSFNVNSSRTDLYGSNEKYYDNTQTPTYEGYNGYHSPPPMQHNQYGGTDYPRPPQSPVRRY